MDHIEALIRAGIAEGKSTEDIAASIATVLNKIEQEENEKNVQKRARENLIRDLIDSVDEEGAAEVYTLKGAVDHIMLALLQEYPTWDDDKVEIAREIAAGVNFIPAIITSPVMNTLTNLINELSKAEENKCKTHKCDSHEGGKCTCNVKKPTAVIHHVSDEDMAIIQGFLASLQD